MKYVIISLCSILILCYFFLRKSDSTLPKEKMDRLWQIYTLDTLDNIKDKLSKEAGRYRSFSRSLEKDSGIRVYFIGDKLLIKNLAGENDFKVLISEKENKDTIKKQKIHSAEDTIMKSDVKNSFINILRNSSGQIDFFSHNDFLKFKEAMKLVNANEFRYTDYYQLLKNSSYKVSSHPD